MLDEKFFNRRLLRSYRMLQRWYLSNFIYSNCKNIGYDIKEWESIPQSSILGVGCGAPVNFAEIHEGKVVVNVGSG